MTRMQQETHEPDTLERLLGEWVETNNDEILQEVHRSRAEDDENKRNVGDEDGDKNNHKIQTLPPKKQATSSQLKRRTEEDQLKRDKGGQETDRN